MVSRGGNTPRLAVLIDRGPLGRSPQLRITINGTKAQRARVVLFRSPGNQELFSDDEFDDFNDEVTSASLIRRKLITKPRILLALAVGTAIFIQSTFAGNITINNGAGREFGQGITQTVACSGSVKLTVKPVSEFINASGAGAFYIKSITVSGIPDSCFGVDFTLNAYDNSTSAALPVFNTTSSNAVIYDNDGIFEVGTGGDGATITSSASAFTFTFTIPVSLASAINKITVQSSPHIDLCLTTGVCTINSRGPGGGTVYFYNAPGFTCGPTLVKTCHYLEVAPAGWSGVAADPSLPFSTPSFDTIHVPSYNGFDASGTALGTGYANTLAIINQNGACATVSTCTYAAGAAHAYRGKGLSDWYLPSSRESNSIATSPDIDFSVLAIINVNADYWNSWSGNPGAPNAATSTVFTGIGGGNNGYEGGYKDKSSIYLVRPIRAF